MAAGKLKKPKTTTLSVRLPIEHKEAIEKVAIDAKTSASAYAARVLLAAVTGKAPAPATPPKPTNTDKMEAVPPTIAKGITLSDPKALDELRRIGININQIAHALNVGRPTDLTRLAQAVAKLFALLKEPEAFMKGILQMPVISLPSTPKPAAPTTAPEAVVPKAPATVPRQPWPEPAKAQPPAKPSVTPVSERRPFPAHLYGEIATALSQQTKPIVLPAATQPTVPAPVAPEAAPRPARRAKRLPSRASLRKALGAASQVPKPHPTTPPAAAAQPVTKDLRRDPSHPQTRHQLQDRAPLRPQRPGPAKDDKPGRLGFLSKLWGR